MSDNYYADKEGSTVRAARIASMYQYHRRKADQAWELAGLARQDGDMADAARHTATAREHEALAGEARQAAE